MEPFPSGKLGASEFQDIEDKGDPSHVTQKPEDAGQGHKRTTSGGIMSKFPFLRMSSEDRQLAPGQETSPPEFTHGDDQSLRKVGSRAMASAISQQRTRKRRGSLRKAALLGRGAQRDRKEIKHAPIETEHDSGYGAEITLSPTSPADGSQPIAFGLGISDDTPRPSMDGYASRSSVIAPTTLPMGSEDHVSHSRDRATSPTFTYTSTTDEDDVLSIPRYPSPPLRNGPQISSGSESYFVPSSGSLSRRRSSQKPKSPLSLGLAPAQLPSAESEWDYSETEWWGWVVLIVTWIVFVVGMGSCLGVWSWAWDVGETPYAPPELEDDPTLPIVGYYPALIILTGVMSWVWVVVAWVGMKYFRHAKISGD